MPLTGPALTLCAVSGEQTWKKRPLLESVTSGVTVIIKNRTSLVVQWIGIHLPGQGTCIWSLMQEDPTCLGATRHVCYKYWACALEPRSHNYWTLWCHYWNPPSLEPCGTAREAGATRRPQAAPGGSSPLTTTGEKPEQRRRPSTAKINM